MEEGDLLPQKSSVTEAQTSTKSADSPTAPLQDHTQLEDAVSTDVSEEQPTEQGEQDAPGPNVDEDFLEIIRDESMRFHLEAPFSLQTYAAK